MKNLIGNNALNTILPLSKPVSDQSKTPGESQNQFANTLKNAIENVNKAGAVSDLKTDALAKGKIDDLHEVMITAQKSSITLETTVQIQKKVIDAYNEVMRMQV